MKEREPVVKHAFEQAVIRLARLSLFADRGEAAGLSFNVTSRQEQLAIDDALHLAIATRRLIDGLDIREFSVNRPIKPASDHVKWLPDERPNDLSLHDILNKLIHSHFIEVYSFSFQLGNSEDILATYEKSVRRENFRIDPLIAIQSDRGPLVICDLRDFCKACDELLELADEVASNHRIFLGEL